MNEDLLKQESHFAFGDNWASYADTINEDRICQATSDLRRLVGSTELTGLRFLDIGCGSGLHALAALRLGAKEVIGIDIDPVSVETARRVLRRYAKEGARWNFAVKSIFDLTPTDFGQFDVVYSWGVLHHTGAMRRAIARTTELTKDGGLLLLALYRKTPMCWFWRLEKRIYSKSPTSVQNVVRAMYLVAYTASLWSKGSKLSERRKGYGKGRGMSMDHDVHDWLGGYPYESIAPQELVRLMDILGLDAVQRFEPRTGALRRLGIMGSGCFEHEYRKRPSISAAGA